MLRSLETFAQHENIQLEKALFDFTGKSMNNASQIPLKSNVLATSIRIGDR